MGVYRVLTQFVNRVPSQGFGGSKPPPYGVRFICLPVENVAFGTISHDGTTGKIRKKPPEIAQVSLRTLGQLYSPCGE